MSIAIVCMVKSVNTTGENRTQVGMCGAIDSDGSVVSQIRLIISWELYCIFLCVHELGQHHNIKIHVQLNQLPDDSFVSTTQG